ncbi:MAG: hypothetical protein DBY45_10385 [Clostridiales bacterium]|nr:MAG: hypothetical protein DBY45_10385 [Clostridiales bacterium]
MATLSQSIRIYDGMSGPLRHITRAMNILIGDFQRMQSVSSNPIDTVGLKMARQEIAQATVKLNQMEQSIKQSNQAQQGFNRSLRSGSDAAGALWNKIKGVAVAAGGLFGTKQIFGLSDQLTGAKARLNLIVDDGGSVASLEQKIMASAQRSRASYLDTMQSVSKLGLLAGKAFSNNDEMIRFAELMNKNFVIAGASTSEQKNAMYQLNQAMASGRLQGDEYRSIIENAPLLAQSIEDYMRNVVKAEGTMKDWSSEGILTATVIKNALFSSADEIEQRFSQMPMTWAQLWETIKNIAMRAFGPLINTIGKGAQFIYENWSTIEPIFWGLVGAVGALSIAFGIWKIYTWAQTAALYGLSAALTATGIGAIVVAIGLIVGAITKWVQSVGGIKVAWLICMDKLQTSWDAWKLAFMLGVNYIKNLWNGLQLAWVTATIAIQNFTGDMKVNVLTTLQNMINGAIDIINKFIGVLNKIPGVNIDLISQMTFATTAASENDAAKKVRNSDLEHFKNQIVSDMEARTLDWRLMQQKAQGDHLNRLVEITAARNEAMAGSTDNTNPNWPDWNSMLQNLGDTAANTARTADALDIADEDLKYIRDLAERDIIDRTTVASITVDMGGVTNQLTSDMDIDGVMEVMANHLSEKLVVAAEGVH